MRRITTFTLVGFIALTTGAAAYVSNEGHRYNHECNVNGMVLRSTYPVSRFVEGGANSRVEEGEEVIYLGISCDAQHEVFGKGRWSWANGGFQIQFADVQIRFPRQEVICDNWADPSVCAS